MGKTIFVIGANSTLGQHILPALRKGSKVITAGRNHADVYCDITKEVIIPDGVDVVINLAAAFGGPDDEEINAAVQTNILGILKICEAAQAVHTHVIHISSVFALLTEDDPLYSIYALTKRQGDELATFYSQSRLPFTILRPSRIYGDTDLFAKGQPFLYRIIDAAAHGEAVTIYGSHDARRNYIHVADLAEIILRVIDTGTTGTYTCTYPTDTAYSQIAVAAQKVFEKGGEVRFLEDKPDIPDDMAVSDTTLYEKLDYSPRISMEDGIGRIKKHMVKGELQRW